MNSFGPEKSSLAMVTRKRRRKMKTTNDARTIANLPIRNPGVLLPLLLVVLWSSINNINEIGSMSTRFAVDAFSIPSSSSLQLREKHSGRTTARTITKPRLSLTSTTTTKATNTATDADASAISKRTEDNDRSVEVWDGVFTPEVCQYLHGLAMDHSERTTSEEDDYYDENDDQEEEDDSLDGSSIFIHRRNNPDRCINTLEEEERLTPLEQALDSFLKAYYESHSDIAPQNDIVVEYWCRQEHLNLEAHADVDEVFFERYCNKKSAASKSSKPSSRFGFRYPTVGHVLYLTRPTLGCGPTCVFPPNKEPQAAEEGNNSNSNITSEISSVVTIPAVPGRVLRFPGHALHAVPKPADVWFSNNNSDDDEDEDEEDNDDDEEWDDEDDDDEERSVVLFNTWEATNDDGDDEENNIGNDDKDTVGSSMGPIGVHRDPMFHVKSDADLVDMMMSSVDIADSGVEVDENFVKGMVDYAKKQKADLLNDWREKFSETNNNESKEENRDDRHQQQQPVVYSKVHCQPRESWKLVQIDADAIATRNTEEARNDGTNDLVASIRVPLMGDKLRRRYSKKAVRWTVPSSFPEGVIDPERPFRFPLATTQS